MNTGWIYLYIGVLIAGVAMPFAKLSNGLDRLEYGIPAMILSIGATICWILSMKHLPLSTAWLIWLGMDAIIMI